MNKIVAILLSIVVSGCAANGARPQANPYDNPRKGYIVYKPIAGIQRWDGLYLEGFKVRGTKYVSNCVSTKPQFSPSKIINAEMYYDDEDQFVYLTHDFSPTFIRCDINREIIRMEAENYISEKKASVMAKIEEDMRQRSAKEKGTDSHEFPEKVEFGGWVATRENLLGSVVLACYTGSSNSGGSMSLSKEEQSGRYVALLSLYKGEPSSIKRITNAYNFARRNLSDRYPLDTMGQYRAGVCDQMVMKGKL